VVYAAATTWKGIAGRRVGCYWSGGRGDAESQQAIAVFSLTTDDLRHPDYSWLAFQEVRVGIGDARVNKGNAVLSINYRRQ
jgi:hypothetical protein